MLVPRAIADSVSDPVLCLLGLTIGSSCRQTSRRPDGVMCFENAG